MIKNQSTIGHYLFILFFYIFIGLCSLTGCGEQSTESNTTFEEGPNEEGPKIVINPYNIDFGNLTLGSTSIFEVIIENQGTTELLIKNMVFSDSINFNLDVNGGLNPCGSTSHTIPTGESCTVEVEFTPQSTGTFTSDLIIESNDSFTGVFAVSIIGICGISGTAGNLYYLSPNGSDSNDGSIDNPWATLEHAVEVAGPGDTIYFRGGTYDFGTGYLIIRKDRGQGGANGQYLYIKNYPGETPILDQGTIRINTEWVWIEGLHFVDSRVTMYIGYGPYAHNIVIKNNTFTGSYRYSAIGPRGYNILIEGNTIDINPTGDTKDHGIYLNAGPNSMSDNIVIRNNYIRGMTGYGIHIYDELKSTGDPLKTIQNIVVDGNYITNSTDRSGIIAACGNNVQIQHVTIKNNVIANVADHGINIKKVPVKLDDIKIYNNTIYDFGTNGIYLRDAEITNVDIKNNIIYDSRNNGWNHVSNEGNSPSITVGNNLYDKTPVLENATDSNPIVGNPSFVDANNGNFYLQSGSAAIDAGIIIPEVPEDKDGVARPQGSAYDIGAYEYH